MTSDATLSWGRDNTETEAQFCGKGIQKRRLEPISRAGCEIGHVEEQVPFVFNLQLILHLFDKVFLKQTWKARGKTPHEEDQLPYAVSSSCSSQCFLKESPFDTIF